MLQEIQMQVTELRKLQQSASSALTNLDETDSSPLLENTVIVTKSKTRKPSESEKLLEEAAKKLEYESLFLFHYFLLSLLLKTPFKKQL